MRRTEQAQGVRVMKFEEVYGRLQRGVLSQVEAAEVLGVSERTFRRWRGRYDAQGASGLCDRRLGRVSARRAPVDEVMQVLELFDTRYWDYGVKHLHETLVSEHGFRRSDNWLRITLQAHGRARPAPRRGAHRRSAGGRTDAAPGGAPTQTAAAADGRHDVAPGRLAARLGAGRDMGSDRHPGRCHVRDLFGVLRCRGRYDVDVSWARRGDRRTRPVLLALRRPRRPLLEDAGGRRQGRQGQSDPGGPGIVAARHRADRRLCAGSARPFRAHVRDPAEAPAAGAARRRDHDDGGGQPLPQGSSTCRATTPRSPAVPPTPARRSCRSPAASPTSCACTRSESSATTTRSATGTARCRSRPTATVITTSRQRCACTNTPTGGSPCSTDHESSSTTTPTAVLATAPSGTRRDPLRRRPGPWICGQRSALTTTPQAQPPRQKRPIHMVPSTNAR